MSLPEYEWYRHRGWTALLWPVSLLFRVLTVIRRRLQQGGATPPEPRVPVIVVGNISIGGTGKTPLLIHLVQKLKKKGFKPGVISRGYGAASITYPLPVTADSDADHCGDEPLLIARAGACPVVIDPDRNAALNYLLQHHDVNVVLSDDGLQHYRLYRDIEIVVVDGQRLFGNGWLLPAGPLREPVTRLQQADFIVVNGEPARQLDALQGAAVMRVEPKYLINQLSGEKHPFSGAPFKMGSEVRAVAGIGNPQRFFDLMKRLPYPVETIAFPDHHRFTREDFDAMQLHDKQQVVMTEKDAVKCQAFAGPNFWTLTIDVSLPEEFLPGLESKLSHIN